MILCSVSIQVSLDLVSNTNRITQEICMGFFFSSVFFFFSLSLLSCLIETLISHCHINPPDKLKMIDSAEETAP